MVDVFDRGHEPEDPSEAEVKELHAKIEGVAVENDFFVARAQTMSPAKKQSMIRRDHPDLSMSQQCKLVNLSRSAFYYTPVGIDAVTLALMKAIDRVFTKFPFFGSRQIATYLRRYGSMAGNSKLDAIRSSTLYIAREVFGIIMWRQRQVNQSQIAA